MGFKALVFKKKWGELKNNLVNQYGNSNKIVNLLINWWDFYHKVRSFCYNKIIIPLLAIFAFGYAKKKLEEHKNKIPGTKSDIDKLDDFLGKP